MVKANRKVLVQGSEVSRVTEVDLRSILGSHTIDRTVQTGSKTNRLGSEASQGSMSRDQKPTRVSDRGKTGGGDNSISGVLNEEYWMVY